MPTTNGKILRDQPLYDTMQLAAAAGREYRFFTQPIGQVIAGTTLKTKAHTNMTQAGQLEGGMSMRITGIGMAICEYAAGTTVRATLVDNIVARLGWLELLINNRPWLSIPASMAGPAGQELNYVSNIPPAATEFHANQGVSHQQNRYNLVEPIDLNDKQEQFAVVLTVPGTIIAVTDVRISLFGVMMHNI